MKEFLAHFVGIVFAATLGVGLVLEGIAIYASDRADPVIIPIGSRPHLDLAALYGKSLPGVVPGFGLMLDSTTAAVAGVFFILVSGILGGLLLVAKEISSSVGDPPRPPVSDRLMAWLADPPLGNEKTRGALPSHPGVPAGEGKKSAVGEAG